MRPVGGRIFKQNLQELTDAEQKNKRKKGTTKAQRAQRRAFLSFVYIVSAEGISPSMLTEQKKQQKKPKKEPKKGHPFSLSRFYGCPISILCLSRFYRHPVLTYGCPLLPSSFASPLEILWKSYFDRFDWPTPVLTQILWVSCFNCFCLTPRDFMDVLFWPSRFYGCPISTFEILWMSYFDLWLIDLWVSCFDWDFMYALFGPVRRYSETVNNGVGLSQINSHWSWLAHHYLE